MCSFIYAIYFKNLNVLKISSLARNAHDAQHKCFDSDSRNEIGTKTLIKLHSISLHIKVQKTGKELNKFIACLSFEYAQIVEIDTLIKKLKEHRICPYIAMFNAPSASFASFEKFPRSQ